MKNQAIQRHAATSQTEWLTTAEIAKRLRISRNRFKDLIQKGILKAGTHFICHGTWRTWDAMATEEAIRELSRRRYSAKPGETYILHTRDRSD